MTKDSKIKIISLAIKEWEKERDCFATACRYAATPEQLNDIRNDLNWTARLKKKGDEFNEIVKEVMENV